MCINVDDLLRVKLILSNKYYKIGEINDLSRCNFHECLIIEQYHALKFCTTYVKKMKCRAWHNTININILFVLRKNRVYAQMTVSKSKNAVIKCTHGSWKELHYHKICIYTYIYKTRLWGKILFNTNPHFSVLVSLFTRFHPQASAIHKNHCKTDVKCTTSYLDGDSETSTWHSLNEMMEDNISMKPYLVPPPQNALIMPTNRFLQGIKCGGPI